MRSRTKTLLALGTILLGVSGCNIATPVFFAVHGPEKVRKEFDLDSGRPTVIFVDDPGSRVSHRRLRAEIGTAAQEALLSRGSLKDVIDTRSALQASASEKYGEPLSVVEIGEAVDAEVVIWVLLTEFTNSTDTVSVSPRATARIKVFDTVSGETLWPVGERGGFPLSIDAPRGQGYAPEDSAEIYSGERELAQRFGLAIAQLFYTVEKPRSVRR